RPSEYLKEFYVGTHPLEVPRDKEDLGRLLELIGGEDTLMFATDWPHHDFDHPSEIRKFPVTADVKQGIWGDNAAEFLGV
ncbi:MAG: amidohydrolase family protein, partial [Halobacteriota archaeon]